MDDIIIIGGKDKVNEVKGILSKEFKMTDLGEVSYLLGIYIDRDRARRTVRLSQP